MADRHIAGDPGAISQDIVTIINAQLAACQASPCDCTCPILIEASSEIERLRAELRDLRRTSSRALWDARNIASALMLALEWHRKSPMLKGTQADQRRYAVDTYDTWQKDWNQVDHAITPPGWMR